MADVQGLIEHIARALVDSPNDVDVKAVQGEKTTVYELRVAETDLGKVIGKHGRTVRAIRTLISASTMDTDQKAVLEVLE